SWAPGRGRAARWCSTALPRPSPVRRGSSPGRRPRRTAPVRPVPPTRSAPAGGGRRPRRAGGARGPGGRRGAGSGWRRCASGPRDRFGRARLTLGACPSGLAQTAFVLFVYNRLMVSTSRSAAARNARTYVPSSVDESEAQRFSEILESLASTTSERPALVGPHNEEIPLPREAFAVLVQVFEAMKQ